MQRVIPGLVELSRHNGPVIAQVGAFRYPWILAQAGMRYRKDQAASAAGKHDRLNGLGINASASRFRLRERRFRRQGTEQPDFRGPEATEIVEIPQVQLEAHMQPFHVSPPGFRHRPQN